MMDELVRKQTVLNMIDDVQFGNITHKLSQLHEAVRNLPSTQQWVPCADRMPSMGERVVVTAVHRKTEAVVIDILRYHGEKYGWENKDICTVVAWMPLPAPYKEVEHDYETDE